MFWHNVQMDRVGVGGDEAYRTRLFLFNVLPPNLDYSSHILKQATQKRLDKYFCNPSSFIRPVQSCPCAGIFYAPPKLGSRAYEGTIFAGRRAVGLGLQALSILGRSPQGSGAMWRRKRSWRAHAWRYFAILDGLGSCGAAATGEWSQGR